MKWLNKVVTDFKDINDTLLLFENCDLSSHISSNDTFNDFEKMCDTKNQDSPKLSEWQPPAEIKDDVFHAIPTYVDNNCVVYLHPKKSSMLKIMQKKKLLFESLHNLFFLIFLHFSSLFLLH